MKFLTLVTLIVFSTSTFAASNKEVVCKMKWDTANLEFNLKFSSTTKAKVVLKLKSSEGMQSVTLPNEVAASSSSRDVTVGFFMGVLNFELPSKLFLKTNLGKSMSVVVKADIEGDESQFNAQCKAVK